jgi:pantoate--beta-alanine ligase
LRVRFEFRGVTTAVATLFHSRMPPFVLQIDAAQMAITGRMVRDQHGPVAIVVCPIVRNPDGGDAFPECYRNPEQRNQVRVLHGSLLRVQAWADAANGRRPSWLPRHAKK